jgi:uncharacterized protein (TIGR03435 family)
MRSHAFVLVAILSAAPTCAQPRAVGYEVSSIRPNKTGDVIFRITPAGNRFVARDVSLFTLIQWAYKLEQSRINGGGPWTKSERFDVEATAPKALSIDQHRLMLQPLLADRFRLETRWETRRMPVYELSATKGASKLKKSTCSGTPSPENPCGTYGGLLGTITGRSATLDVLAGALSGILGREVLNKTGIQGTWDFNLSWTPDAAVGAGGTNANGDDLSIFTAVREQLGMKLTPATGPVEILVIVDARRPAPN